MASDTRDHQDNFPSNQPALLTLAATIVKSFDYTFVSDTDFYWSSATTSLHFCPPEAIEDIWFLLHELGHAELSHEDYELDIELLAQEAAAWQHASKILAPRFGIAIDEAFSDSQLDTYRDWLHARSRCPNCQQAGVQQTSLAYFCFNCNAAWNANDARRRRLKRTRLDT